MGSLCCAATMKEHRISIDQSCECQVKTINELTGFAVLTGPLWLVVLLVIASVWIGVMASRRFRSGWSRVVVGLAVIALVVGVPFLDGVAGRAYLHYLCATKAGVKVYHTVQLSGIYWNEAGSPKFLKPNGDLDNSVLNGRFSEPVLKIPYSAPLAIDEYRQQVVDNDGHQVLGEVVTYMHWGGWLVRSLNPGGPSAVRCEGIRGPKLWDEFHKSLFKRSVSK
jgi:hypothetical protein